MKYEITEMAHPKRKRLYRIRALRAIPRFGIMRGDLGGYIQSAENLSQHGDCWVGGDACINGSARVMGDAYIGDKAFMNGRAIIHDSVVVSDHARITYRCRITGFAKISEKASVGGRSRITDHVEVSGKTIINDHARLSGFVRVKGSVKILGDSLVSGSVLVKDNVVIKGTAEVSGDFALYGKRIITEGVWNKSDGKDDSIHDPKYRITDDRHSEFPDLRRIVALKDIKKHNIFAGHLGGFVQSEDNLSHNGDCWIDGNAIVFENARVTDNALVTDGASVQGHAIIKNRAKVKRMAVVFENAVIGGSAVITDRAIVSSRTRVMGKVVVSGLATLASDTVIKGKESISSNSYLSEPEIKKDAVGPKYEITNDAHPDFPDLKRIIALHDIERHGVKKGDKGGYVSGSWNLSQFEDAWIDDDAIVRGFAFIDENALVSGCAAISDSAVISGFSKVCDTASISGFSYVTGYANISGDAVILDCVRVDGDAYIGGNSIVSDTCWITESSTLTSGVYSGCAIVTKKVSMELDVRVSKNLILTGDAPYYWRKH